MSTGVSFGVLSNFDHLTHEWNSYKSRLTQWFIANDITDATDKAKVKRRAILLSALSESTYNLANDLALPKKVEEIDYCEILKILDDHFTPKRFGFAEKSTFYSATQHPGESHTQWAARIRGLAAHCGFKCLEEALLDKFIMGMVAGHERDKLFAQDQKDLSLAKAVDMAESVRCARRAATAAPGGSGARAPAAAPPPDFVCAISKRNKCSVCGYNNHQSIQCRFKNYKCKKCNRKGHLRKMCTHDDKVNIVEVGSVESGDDGEFVFNIRCLKGRPMVERVNIGGLILEFQIDSGSAVSLLSESTYRCHFSKIPLSPTNKRLVSYTGENIMTCGLLQLPVTYNKKTHTIELHVVRENSTSLLGRDFIQKFNLELVPVNAVVSKSDGIEKKLVEQFPTVFSGKLGEFNKYTVKLSTKPGSKPIFFKARPVPFAMREKIDKELDRLVDLGVLKPVEYSEYASPVVPALKKDGGLRLCADYSVTINKQLLVDKYPLPTVKELFSKLNGGVQFSKIDLSMAYNQFRLNEASQNLTVINTHRGLFKFTRLVFGLSSAPAIFQRAMECVLAGLEGVVFFLDDVLVTGENEEQHKQRLTSVLQRLQEAGLTVQPNKCEFYKNEISYLGHIIDRNGIRKSPDKIKAILNANKPQNVTQLQSFLGLTNYYRNFVPDASSLLSPLYKLLHKNAKWEWTVEQEEAYKKIKALLSSEKVLTHYDPDAKLILTVDASPTGLGAILSQISQDGRERPVCYASRTLNSAEKNYSQIQREATAIIFGVRRFHQYLYGRASPFVLRTDHKPLLTIFGPHRGIPEVSANRLQRYAIFLSAYNYTIQFIRSSNNSADFLSRVSEGPNGERGAGESGAPLRNEGCSELETASYVNFIVEGNLPVTLHELRQETDRDPVLSKVKDCVTHGWPRKVADSNLRPYHNCRFQLSIENGVLMRGHKVVIPQSLREIICNELHSSHFGIIKMKAESRKRLWFPGIDSTLEKLAAACTVCAALRPSPPHVPLAPWPHPPSPFYRVHLDFLGPINNQMFLIIVDAYSKWIECYLMSNSYGSTAVISKLCDYMSRVGVPHTLVSDNGTSFTSLEFNQFCKRNGIKHVLSPAYHPSSNGQAESMVKIVKKGIKSIILNNTNKRLLQEQLSKFLFDYRNSINSTTEKSPAEIIYGRQLRSRLDLIKPPATTTVSTDLSQAVGRKQSLQAKYYKGTKRSDYNQGEEVWITKHLGNKKYTWIEGVIMKKLGAVMYLVFVPTLNYEVTKHIDQMRTRTSNSGFTEHYWDPDIIEDVYQGNDNNVTTPSDSTLNTGEEGNEGSGHIAITPLSRPVPRRCELRLAHESPPDSSDNDSTQYDSA